MNKQNILDLADLIEQQPDYAIQDWPGDRGEGGFSMEAFEFPCGTPACIAGHASALSGAGDTLKDIGEWLGLEFLDAHGLCLPQHHHAHFNRKPGQPGHITAQRAADTLRRLVKTGKVEWGAE